MKNANPEITSLLPGVPVVESPFFELLTPKLSLTAEELRIARDLNTNGYAVFNFPDPHIHTRIERIKTDLKSKFNFDHWAHEGWQANVGLRVQDAWQYHDDVKAIASNSEVLKLLGRIYGRKAFAFQTLNFPVGTQQHYHSDAIHFSSVPERFMCGVWLALEDIHMHAGPLIYYPGSHKWPILYNDMLGRRVGSSRSRAAQEPYERIWRAMVEASGIKPELFLARKGQALIWAANLLHGGSRQQDPKMTRWSQVNHYYFEQCSYYTPAFSDLPVGNLDLRTIRNIENGDFVPNIYVDRPITEVIDKGRQLIGSELDADVHLPDDFDSKRYYELNPDVLASGLEAATHYLIYGAKENRRVR